LINLIIFDEYKSWPTTKEYITFCAVRSFVWRGSNNLEKKKLGKYDYIQYICYVKNAFMFKWPCIVIIFV
jgi:hypothetical protein